MTIIDLQNVILGIVIIAAGMLSLAVGLVLMADEIERERESCP